MNRILQQYNPAADFPGVRITIPQTVVIAADYFDAFMVDNGLKYVVNTEGITDEEILSEFVSPSAFGSGTTAPCIPGKSTYTSGRTFQF